MASKTAETVRTYARKAKDALSGANPLEMLIFGAGGYEISKVLDASGIADLVGGMVPGWQPILASRGKTFGQGMSKVAGAALFAHSAYESRKGGIKKGVLNCELPLSVGMMIDAPNGGSPYGAASANGGWR